MTPADRKVRAAAYRHIVETSQRPDVPLLAELCGLSHAEVRESLDRLEKDHLLARTADGEAVRMLHPFSGVATGHRSIIGEREWHANCAWDALAILALMGDGVAVSGGPSGTIEWKVAGGQVTPPGIFIFACRRVGSGTTSPSPEATSEASGRMPSSTTISRQRESKRVIGPRSSASTRCQGTGIRAAPTRSGIRSQPGRRWRYGGDMVSSAPSGSWADGSGRSGR